MPTSFVYGARGAAIMLLLGHAIAGSSYGDSPGDFAPTRTPASQSVLDLGDSGFRIAVEATYLYGPASGYLQTPSGDEPGTTSIGRPTLGELGISSASIFDTALTLGSGRHELFIGGQFIGFSGQATLDETLISQNQTFLAGSAVEQEVELNWYRAGYRYWFLFDTDDQSPGDEFAIAPSVGAGLFDFTYKLEGPGDADVNRTYIKPMPQVGIEAEWKLSQRCSVVAGVLTSVPIPDTPFILSTRLAGKYRVLDNRSIKLDALVGVGYERLQYDEEKKQETPNDINVELGPLLLLSVKAEF